MRPLKLGFLNCVQDDTIRNLFSTRTYHEYSPHTLLAYLVIFYTLSVITFGIAVPAGQFVPGIMVGATYGRLVGMLVVHVSSREDIDEGTYALLGAASFLGGSMRMTVSLCVIMAEITNNLKLLPLIMLVLLVAKAVGDGFNRGFYEVHAVVRKIPLLESHAKRFMRQFTAKDAVNRQVCGASWWERQ
jgi:chloride channel 7